MDDERTPPERVRISRLQEVQLPDIEKVDRASAGMYEAAGFDAGVAKARSYADLADLTRGHNVLVVEADWKPAGYVAWRDEAPGVAVVEALAVDPELQRFGLGGRLVEAVRDDARKAGLKHIVVRAWAQAVWAMGFLRKCGFHEADTATLPNDVMAWVTRQEQPGEPLVRPGEALLFAEVGEAAPEPEEPEETPETEDLG
ncbi:MAG: GNAT family N-acetyltransferase [Polyangiaceae bacterium]